MKCERQSAFSDRISPIIRLISIGKLNLLLSCATQCDELCFGAADIYRHNEVEMNDDDFPIGGHI